MVEYMEEEAVLHYLHLHLLCEIIMEEKEVHMVEMVEMDGIFQYLHLL